MSSSSSDQLDLLETARQRPFSREAGMLGLVIDQEEFLQFLSEEWLHPKRTSWLLLGTSDACAEQTPGDNSVAVWFDVQKLPNAPVVAWRKGAWCETTSKNFQRDDLLVAWNGPLPLFAVDHFEVNSESTRMQALALARNFADMTIPSQPMRVGKVYHVRPPHEWPGDSTPCLPPENWDAIRGAAAMAAYAVPAIDPWVDLFCQVLRRDAEAAELAEILHSPWWKVALWHRDIGAREDLPALWRAIVDEFSQRGRLREWRAKDILESVCEKAISLGEDGERIQNLRSGAMDLLNDRVTVEGVASRDDNLALTLQLLLLRPSPEKFLGWRDDWAAIPPSVWWTGMTLAGYLQGYRSLPKQFRGTNESQKLLALKTWQLAGKVGSGPWNEVTANQVGWSSDEDNVVLEADGAPWAQHKLGTRGHWFRADFSDRSIQAEAEVIALEACPDAIVSMVTLNNVSVPLGGSGIAKLSMKLRRLDIEGRIELPVGHGVALENQLDFSRFRDWLATASITRRIRRPLVETNERSRYALDVRVPDSLSKPSRSSSPDNGLKPRATKKSPAQRKATIQATSPPIGLTLLEDFISAEEEKRIFTIIESLEWDRSMKRRVQHFGWRYDYKARKVDPKSYLGPLPAWAQELAERLLELNVVSELPDQVIVNNYDGNQGIAKHIDCPECFLGPVVTISLLETWDMIFTRKLADGTSERFVQLLRQRSAAVLAEEARSTWYHEIPGRAAEHGVPRIRRISITFRKVAPTTAA